MPEGAQTMSKNFYITTPIYYVNDIPHIGSAYTTLICDVVARYKRMSGYDVKFLTGTDEHGQKVQDTAQKKGVNTQEFVDNISSKFRYLCEVMNFSNDDFIRTTEERHKKGAKKFWQLLLDKGYIYKGEYSGWYAVKDEAFYSEKELVDGKAPTGAEVKWLSEESYFFKLSAFQDKLLEFYHQNPDFVCPRSRFNEVINFVEQGLEDLSISRTSFDWGIEVPGDERHVMYVWLDALTNYITALGYPDENAKDYQKFWPANIHMVGKDITRFHAIFWPAFLMAAELPLPKKIVSHGWWLIEGQKMSKSLGNVVNPVDLVEEYGLDEIRYYLMREISFGQDGNFARNTIKARVNGELANKIGNLVQRTLAMVSKNCNDSIPDIPDSEIIALYANDSLLSSLEEVFGDYQKKMNENEYNRALDVIVGIAERANEYIDHKAPWSLKKTDINEMKKVLYVLCETIRYLAIILWPYIPGSSEKIIGCLGLGKDDISFDKMNKDNALVPSSNIVKPDIIFNKVL